MSSGGKQSNGNNEILPIAILLFSLILGGALLTNLPTGDTAYVYWILIVFCALGVLYVGIGFKTEYESDGLNAAVNWLINGTISNSSSSNTQAKSPNPTEKTPPPSEKLKNELYFDRADQECEWCQKRTDTPEIHHIKPKSEGGPNNQRNLIVLCPDCHRKADGGMMGRSKLKYRVREQIDRLES